MASTQKLTELPVIQYTGMDYSNVISQIKNIIENNNEWNSNWTQFYSSEAGSLLIQLMAWICDNLAVRQDLLYNESFISTAKNYSSKLRLLNQIKYDIKCSKAAVVPITITTDKVIEENAKLSCYGYTEGSKASTHVDYTRSQLELNGIRSIKNSIFTFQAPNVNGENTTWEILDVDDSGKVNYKTTIELEAGDIEYKAYKKMGSEIGTTKDVTLKAVQGTTVYKEFFSDTSNEPVFDLKESDIDLNSLVVFDIKGNSNNYKENFTVGKEHVRVENFIDITTVQNYFPCYIVERNDDNSIQIRYPSEDIGFNSTDREDSSILRSHFFKAGHTIGVFYRKCNGKDGNVNEKIFNVKTTIKTTKKPTNIVITNVLPGYNGKNMESIDTSIKNAPLSLKTLNRAVTSSDYDVILKNNSDVLVSKTFTPDNMPKYFSKFYGREIYPHEAFSIVIPNKNIKNIPSAYLNRYPFVETIESHAVNEKVSFTEHEFNIRTSRKTPEVFGLAIKDTYINNGDEYKQAVKTKEDDPNYYVKLLKNAVIFNTGSDLFDIVNNEKINYKVILDEDDDNGEIDEEKKLEAKKAYELVAKINEKYYNGNSFKEIKSYFFENEDDKILKTNNNVLTEESSASFTSFEEFAKDSKIDCYIDPIKVVIDDNVEFEIKIKELVKEEIGRIYNKIKGDNNSIKYEDLIINEEFFTIPISNTPSTDERCIGILSDYISGGGDNVGEVQERFRQIWANDFKLVSSDDISSGNGTNTSLTATKEVKTAAEDLNKLKKGLVEIINEYYDKEIKEIETLNANIIEDSTEEDIKKNYIKYKRAIRQLKEFKRPSGFNIEGDKAGGYYYGTLYQDIGLDVPMLSNEQKTINFKDGYYYLKINGYVYAIKIDNITYTTKVKNFYTTINNNFLDLYRFDGLGYLDSNNPLANNIISNLDDNVYLKLKLSNDIAQKKVSYTKITTEQLQADFNNGEIRPDTLALILEFALSPFNMENDVIYRLDKKDDDSKLVWTDIGRLKKEESDKFSELQNSYYDDAVINGRIRVSSFSKKYYNYDSINSYEFGKDDVNNEIKKCYDIRFEDIRTPCTELKIGSASQLDFVLDDQSLGDNIKIPAINGEENKIFDLFECLFGCERNYTTTFPDENRKLVDLKETRDNGDIYNFVISSKKTGINSKLYLETVLTKNDDTENSKKFFDTFNCKNLTKIESIDGEKTITNYYTPKVFGVKRMEMFNAGDSLNYEDETVQISYDAIRNGTKQNESSVIQVGDIIFTDSDINMVNIPSSAFLSYISKYNDNILIDKQRNLYYSSDEDANEEMTIKVSGIKGQVYKKTKDTIEIDDERSDYNVKITDKPVDFTNNFYCINESNEDKIEFNKAVKSKSFSISTLDQINDIDLNKSEEITFAFSIDDYAKNSENSDGSDEVQSTEGKIAVEVNIENGKVDIPNMYTKLQSMMAGSDEYSNDRYQIVRKYVGSDTRLVFSNVSNDIDGNITFYLINSNEELTSNYLYKTLFGTSRTNSEFYRLYPREEIEELNSVVNVIDDNNEYYYAPTFESPLKFKFRTFENEKKEKSKYADYYIKSIKKDSGSGYDFYLYKTENSILPDGDFYIHYINDRTYEPNRDIDEDALNKYMEKYIIAGTKMRYLNPFFRTFDVSGIVYYDSNLEQDNVQKAVDEALSNKYKIDNIENLGIGNKIYLSDIMKTILDVNGVEHVEITYFGFDITNQSEYPSHTKYLSVDEAYDFYTTILLAETDGKHGNQLAYTPSDN